MKANSPKKKTPVKAEVDEKDILLMQIDAEQNSKKIIEDDEKRCSLMLMQSPFAFALLKGKDMVITIANDSIKQMWGKGNKIEGKPLLEILPEIKDQELPGLLQKVYTTGIPYFANEALARVKQKSKMEDRFFNFAYQPNIENDKTISGVVIFGFDVTEEVLARRKIEESEKKFQAAILAVEGIIWTNSAAGEMIGEQLGWANLTGQRFEEYQGYGWSKAIHPDDAQPTVEAWNKAVADQSTFEFEHRVKTNADGWKLFSVKAIPVFDDNDAIQQWVGVHTNISKHREAEEKIKESESRFRAMADTSPVLIWTMDFQGLSSYYNKTFLDFVGISKDEDNSDWRKIVHPDDVHFALDTVNKSIAEHHFHSFECRLLRADGQWRWVLSQGNPRIGANNEFLGFVGSSVDITERKLFEEKLMEANVLAENAAKAKQQFLSNMSHEIRTPLNSIIGFTNVLMKTELGVEQKEFVQAINTSGKSLNLLINDILDLAKVDAGRMTFVKQPFEIRKSIKSILYSFDLKIKEKNLELIKEYDSKIPALLVGDSVRLNQIILNLISNAVKFTHKGKIILNIKLLHEDDENVTIEFAVTDSGIGIAANKINSIFNLFEQADLNISTSYGGTGLGLAIIKQLIEEQGGSISLKSKLGEGSTFSFILPFGKTNLKSEEEIEIPTLNSEIKNLRVLVAEDVALNQLLIKIILKDFGFEHEIVANGKLAIEKMKTNTYDIILMDLHMPEINGYEATEYIRKTLKSQTPIIALTADVTTADVNKCKEFGMDDYISKPINENLLYSKMVELVKKNQ